jgi:hypothetical protein
MARSFEKRYKDTTRSECVVGHVRSAWDTARQNTKKHHKQQAYQNENANRFAHFKKKLYLCSAKVKINEQGMLQPQAKQQLIGLLKQEQCFWSYSPDSIDNISDDILIEKVLLYLDMPEIDLLFQIYSYQKIKQVWLDKLIPQLDYYYSLNRFFAWYYFKSKRPDQYVKSMATRRFNQKFK